MTAACLCTRSCCLSRQRGGQQFAQQLKNVPFISHSHTCTLWCSARQFLRHHHHHHTVLHPINNQHPSERLSSYSSMSLETLTQSFYLQHAIKGLGVSQTLQGIATKQLLLHTMHDQV